MSQDTTTIPVWVTPGASRDAVAGLRQDSIHLRVASPARQGRANAAVEALLARSLGIPGSGVRILRGHTSRRKLVAIQGLTHNEVLQLLGLDSTIPEQ